MNECQKEQGKEFGKKFRKIWMEFNAFDSNNSNISTFNSFGASAFSSVSHAPPVPVVPGAVPTIPVHSNAGQYPYSLAGYDSSAPQHATTATQHMTSLPYAPGEALQTFVNSKLSPVSSGIIFNLLTVG